LTEDDFVNLVAVQIGALEQLAGGIPREIHGARVFQRRAGFGEWRPDAGDDCHATTVETGH